MKRYLLLGWSLAFSLFIMTVLFPACGSKTTPTSPVSTDTPTPVPGSPTNTGTPTKTTTASPTPTGTASKTATTTPTGTTTSTATQTTTRTITPTPIPTHPFLSNNPTAYPTIILPYSPLGIAEDSSNNLYVAAGFSTLYRYNSAGVSLSAFSLSGIFQGGGVAVDSTNGYLYVADYGTGSNKVARYVLGSGSTASGSPVTGQSGVSFNFSGDPVGVAVDGSGNLYVGDYLNSAIQEFDMSGAAVTVWSLPHAPNYPFGVAYDSTSGYIFISSNSGQIIKYLPPNGAPSTVVNTTVGFAPVGIALDSNGNIYTANFDYTDIDEFNSSGTHLTNIGSYGQGNGQFGSLADQYGPEFLAVDSSGNIFATDPYNNRIESFGP